MTDKSPNAQQYITPQMIDEPSADKFFKQPEYLGAWPNQSVLKIVDDHVHIDSGITKSVMPLPTAERPSVTDSTGMFSAKRVSTGGIVTLQTGTAYTLESVEMAGNRKQRRAAQKANRLDSTGRAKIKR